MSHHHHHNCPLHDHHHACCCHQHSHDESCCNKGHHEHDDFPHKLLEMADEAWMEVLKEKIKAHVEATSGAKLEKLAKIVAEANNSRWEQKLQLLDIAHNFVDRIRSFFSQKK